MRILDLLTDEPLQNTLREVAAQADPSTVPLFERLVELLCFLESEGPATKLLFGTHDSHKCEVFLSSNRRASMTISIDFYDTDRLDTNGPALHYRMQIRREGSKLSLDDRTDDPRTVLRQVLRTL